MNFSILGAGTWGATLAQVLIDNGHDVMLYDVNQTTLDDLGRGCIPMLDYDQFPNVLTTNSLVEALAFSHNLVITVPTAYIREVMQAINQVANRPLNFINGSKGIEPITFKRVSQIIADEIDPNYLNNYALLAGPSHAEELILRQVTLLTAASLNHEYAIEVQNIFNNDTYLRVYTSDDLIGAELGGSIKNAIAVAAGISTGFGFNENARAALITKGVREIIQIVEFFGGKRETAFGLTGIGDLIVTASSMHSRNFKAGLKIGKGENAEDVYIKSKMVVEGIRSIIAYDQLAKKHNLELPIIQTTYKVIKGEFSVDEALNFLLSRELKSEKL